MNDKVKPPGEYPKPPAMPPKNPGRDKSKDNEIKMQMAKDIFCKFLEVDTPDAIMTGTVDPVETSCKVAEKIFNRFNK